MRGTVAGTIEPCLGQRFIPAHAGNSVRSLGWPPAQPVHPRACGEQRSRRRPGARGGGSSPRMRGTETPGVPRVPRGRFIPAHAGNSSTWLGTLPWPPVHPRACGEQGKRFEDVEADIGSSPRMRGTALRQVDLEAERRFIPAHAGNRTQRCVRSTRPPVHPRACGEQCVEARPIRNPVGSSPRMRGTDQGRRSAG